MPAPILNQRDLEFFLYEFFNVEQLTERERYQDHDKETFDAAITIARQVAEKYFLPIQKKVDANEPTFDGKKVHMLPEIKEALEAVKVAGLAAPTTDFDIGGMQLPLVVNAAVSGYISAAASTTVGYLTLTHANCNLIEAYGTPEQKAKWVQPMREGRFTGTMSMTEPGAGSGLADLITSAEKDKNGEYRIKGNKIWTSGGDHDLSENIVHLVLARVKGAPKGVKGISLFIVPKFLVNDAGEVTEKNEVELAGLFHKMGGRGHTSTALSFGEQDGAIGYLVGEENQGLRYMFHMMNEARILVGSGAALTALTGFQYSLDYAKERPQGRLLSNKDPLSSPVNIIEHPDVKRMLLIQKSYAEGAFALCAFGSQLADDEKTAVTDDEKKQASTLLDFLTPVIKSWPSDWCPKANDLAIQVLGGHGYINEHPVELYYRDNRLNPIHEGTRGIQSLDLIARKVPMRDFAGYKLFLAQIETTLNSAYHMSEIDVYAEKLAQSVHMLKEVTTSVLRSSKDMNLDLVFSNSAAYLDMFGHITISWLWLKQAMVAQKALNQGVHGDDVPFYKGKIQAMKFFINTELPKCNNWGNLVMKVDSTAFDMQPEWF